MTFIVHTPECLQAGKRAQEQFEQQHPELVHDTDDPFTQAFIFMLSETIATTTARCIRYSCRVSAPDWPPPATDQDELPPETEDGV